MCVLQKNKPVDWDHKAPLDKGETFIISGCTSNWTESVFQQASLSYTVLRFSVTLLIGWCIVNTAKWVPASSAMKEEQLNAVCALTVQMKKFIVISSLAVVHRAFHKWKKRLELRLCPIVCSTVCPIIHMWFNIPTSSTSFLLSQLSQSECNASASGHFLKERHCSYSTNQPPAGI